MNIWEPTQSASEDVIKEVGGDELFADRDQEFLLDSEEYVWHDDSDKEKDHACIEKLFKQHKKFQDELL
jgi:hypothetical protein